MSYCPCIRVAFTRPNEKVKLLAIEDEFIWNQDEFIWNQNPMDEHGQQPLFRSGVKI